MKKILLMASVVLSVFVSSVVAAGRPNLVFIIADDREELLKRFDDLLPGKRAEGIQPSAA